jgi:CBS domain-containing protein
MKVKDILDSKGRRILTVHTETSIEQIVAELSANKVGFLIVVDQSGALAGVISERDVVHRCMSAKKDPVQTRAAEIMTPKTQLFTATEQEDIESIMATMTGKKVRHVPVLQGDQVVGVISIGDVIKFILEEKNQEILSLKDYVSR